jgi:predicted  nucleic acid-binding Zn-ribbon protein
LKKNPDSPDSQALEKIIRQALDEVVTLDKRRKDLQAERLKLLEARQAARQRLENEIQTTRRDTLSRLTGVGT